MNISGLAPYNIDDKSLMSEVVRQQDGILDVTTLTVWY